MAHVSGPHCVPRPCQRLWASGWWVTVGSLCHTVDNYHLNTECNNLNRRCTVTIATLLSAPAIVLLYCTSDVLVWCINILFFLYGSAHVFERENVCVCVWSTSRQELFMPWEYRDSFIIYRYSELLILSSSHFNYAWHLFQAPFHRPRLNIKLSAEEILQRWEVPVRQWSPQENLNGWNWHWYHFFFGLFCFGLKQWNNRKEVTDAQNHTNLQSCTLQSVNLDDFYLIQVILYSLGNSWSLDSPLTLYQWLRNESIII